MSVSARNWSPMIRQHIVRLLIVEYMQAAYRPAFVACGVVLLIGLISQIVPVVWRTSLIIVVGMLWVIVTFFIHRRRWRDITVNRRLDVAYGWQSALTTMSDFASRHDEIATTQRMIAIDTITATPVSRLAYPRLRTWLSGVLLVCMSGVVMWLPTPFDQQILAQQQIRSIAQTTADTLATLPAVPDMSLPMLQQQIVSASDAQGLLATLTQAQTTLERAQTANQTWQQALNQARSADDASQIDAATRNALTGDQRAQLDTAIAASQQGDTQPLDELQAAAQMRSQTLAEWQQALRQSAAQTRASANAGSGADPRGVDQQSGGEGSGADPRGVGQQSGGEVSGADPRGVGQQSGGEGSGADPRGVDQQSGGEGSGADPRGVGQQSGGGEGTGQAGGGAGSGAGSDTVSLFVPGLAEGAMLDIPTDSVSEGGRDIQISDTSGADVGVTVTYAEVVRQASEQASQAIESAQIPWTSEGIVRDYFRQLQGEQP